MNAETPPKALMDEAVAALRMGRASRLRCLAPHAGSPGGICDVRLTRKRVRKPDGAKRKVWWCERCQEVRG